MNAHARTELTDVALADFLRDLDVGTVDGTQEQTAVETELHVRRTGRLRSGGGDVLTDVRRGDEDLSERDGVVREEVEAEEVLGVGVVVDDTGDIDDQADGLWSTDTEGQDTKGYLVQGGVTHELGDIV